MWSEGGDTVPGSVGSAELADWLPAGQEIIFLCVRKEFDHGELLEHRCGGLSPVSRMFYQRDCHQLNLKTSHGLMMVAGKHVNNWWTDVSLCLPTFGGRPCLLSRRPTDCEITVVSVDITCSGCFPARQQLQPQQWLQPREPSLQKLS